jgi:hypothetical protein
MIDAITAIYNKLSTYTVCYYVEAPIKTLPYATFNFNIPSTNFQTGIVELVVDLWDNDITRVETLRQTVWRGMDGFIFNNDNMALSTRQLSNFAVADPNIAIQRRQLTFQVLIEGA